jgi:ubiquinone/menaquinone biosynthesis C-methylase UbiE
MSPNRLLVHSHGVNEHLRGTGDLIFMTAQEGTRRTYERIARFYDFLDLPFEVGRYRRLRPLLFAGLSGRILDAGVGTGRNIPFYPPGAEFVAIDQSRAMLKRAARRRARTSASVQLMEMDVLNLSFPDSHFDAAVASFLMCTLSPERRRSALKELGRAVRPAGVVRLLEYAPAQGKLQRLSARLWQPWARWAFGARLGDMIENDVAAAGLMVIKAEYVTGSIKLIEARPEGSR